MKKEMYNWLWSVALEKINNSMLGNTICQGHAHLHGTDNDRRWNNKFRYVNNFLFRKGGNLSTNYRLILIRWIQWMENEWSEAKKLISMQTLGADNPSTGLHFWLSVLRTTILTIIRKHWPHPKLLTISFNSNGFYVFL